MANRPDVVEALVQAALQGMMQVGRQLEPNNDEVMSAYFTMVRRGINSAMSITTRPDLTRPALRTSLLVILADLPEPTLH